MTTAWRISGKKSAAEIGAGAWSIYADYNTSSEAYEWAAKQIWEYPLRD